MSEDKYELVAGREVFGEEGQHGVRLSIMCPRVIDADEKWALQKLSEKASDLLAEGTYRLNPKRIEESERQRTKLLGLFSDSIFVEEIPNVYCSKYCCEHLPWFVVTTRIGRIELGWRKRVIQIDYSDTTSYAPAEVLFPNESVTKSERLIHAWSYEAAARYLAAIFAAPPLLKVGDSVQAREPQYSYIEPGDRGTILKVDAKAYRYLIRFDRGEIETRVACNEVELEKPVQ